MDFGDSSQTFITFVSVLGFLMIIFLATILFKNNSSAQEYENNYNDIIGLSRTTIAESSIQINEVGDFPEDYIDPLPLYEPRSISYNNNDYTDANDANYIEAQMQQPQNANDPVERPPIYHHN
jgi:hypothetical protein